jgi:hypothetical protein
MSNLMAATVPLLLLLSSCAPSNYSCVSEPGTACGCSAWEDGSRVRVSLSCVADPVQGTFKSYEIGVNKK